MLDLDEIRCEVAAVMSDEPCADKSPRSPNYNLQDALEDARKLHLQIGKAVVKPESAAIALGYKGMNGAALTTLGTLSQYGLIARSKGTVQITPLAIRILHSVDESQHKQALVDAALSPRVFKEIHERLPDCAVEVLTSHLIQDGFTPDRAKRAATIYAANKGFAKLTSSGTTGHVSADPQRTERSEIQDKKANQSGQSNLAGGLSTAASGVAGGAAKVLAQYTIPLGANQATLVFTGHNLSVDDFDALIDFVTFSKRQFERAEKSRGAAAIMSNFLMPARLPDEDAFPKVAMWRNKDHDRPVKITGLMGEKDGEKYYQSEEGTGIPASELQFDDQ